MWYIFFLKKKALCVSQIQVVLRVPPPPRGRNPRDARGVYRGADLIFSSPHTTVLKCQLFEPLLHYLLPLHLSPAGVILNNCYPASGVYRGVARGQAPTPPATACCRLLPPAGFQRTIGGGSACYCLLLPASALVSLHWGGDKDSSRCVLDKRNTKVPWHDVAKIWITDFNVDGWRVQTFRNQEFIDIFLRELLAKIFKWPFSDNLRRQVAGGK